MSVDGVSPRMADIATVLSVYEYTNRRPAQSGSRPTRPKVEAASSRSQMSSLRSSSLHCPTM